jgi:hypothetical protein
MICSMFSDPQALADRAERLRRRAESEPPESWRPDRPELGHPASLIGELLAISDGPDRGYGPMAIAEIRDLDGRVWALWLLGAILRAEFLERESRPRVGDLVGVHYQGRRQGTSAEYRSWRVVVDRAAPSAASELPGQTPFAGVEPPPVVVSSGACEACGMLAGHHAAGCPLDDVPF